MPGVRANMTGLPRELLEFLDRYDAQLTPDSRTGLPACRMTRDFCTPRPYVSLLTVAIALGVILLTGILARLMAAVRASRITPVEALRHE